MTRAPLSLSAGAVALAGACALWLGFPNDLASLPPLVLLWPVALAWLGVNAPDRGAALRRGWLCHLAGGTAALYWLTLPVHNVGGLPWALAVPCALFIAACLALAGSLFALAAHELRPPSLLALGRGSGPVLVCAGRRLCPRAGLPLAEPFRRSGPLAPAGAGSGRTGRVRTGRGLGRRGPALRRNRLPPPGHKPPPRAAAAMPFWQALP